MIHTLLMVAHVFLALTMIALILIQRGKGADAGTGFGAGASGTVFGSRGSASFLTRTTGALATFFFITSLSLAFLANQPVTTTGSSVTELVPEVSEPLPSPGELSDLPSLMPETQTELPSIPAPSGEAEQSDAAPDAEPPAPAAHESATAGEHPNVADVVELVATLS